MARIRNAQDPLANSLLWLDPYPQESGTLGADWIEMLATEAEMITPFCRDNLKPASYELTLGSEFQRDGRTEKLTDENPKLTIPPNSIVFVTMGEMLRLPHYVVGRFDLSISLIYRGLLLGTGPQVDPGFHGRLSCPLHNISNNPIYLERGETFVKIEFQKTTGLGSRSPQFLKSLDHEDSLYENPNQLQGVRGYRAVLFSRDRRFRTPIIGYQKNVPDVRSSVKYLEDYMHRRFSQLAWGAFISVAGIVISVFLAVGTGFYQMIDSMESAESESRAAVEIMQTATALEEQLLATQTAMDVRYTATLSALEDNGPDMEATPIAYLEELETISSETVLFTGLWSGGKVEE